MTLSHGTIFLLSSILEWDSQLHCKFYFYLRMGNPSQQVRDGISISKCNLSILRVWSPHPAHHSIFCSDSPSEDVADKLAKYFSGPLASLWQNFGCNFMGSEHLKLPENVSRHLEVFFGRDGQFKHNNIHSCMDFFQCFLKCWI